MISVVILAGGRGTRFWPLSRQKNPKQFHALMGERTLLQEAYDRACAVTAPENIFVSTAEDLVEKALEQLPIQPWQVMAEPQARNTAPCLLWCTSLIAKKLGADTTVLTIPSDHCISKQKFVEDVELAKRYLEAHSTDLLTFGVPPRSPHTGYGYIQRETMPPQGGVYKVKAFVEKPDRTRAEKFMKSGDYYWNAGIFMWKAEAFLNACKTYVKGVEKFLSAHELEWNDKSVQKISAQTYAQLEATSVDYGIFEKHAHVAVMPAHFLWNDIGSWGALWEELMKQDDGNVQSGKNISLKSCERTLVMNRSDIPVKVIGTKDLIIVQTADALLVCDRDHDQEIKHLLETLDPSLR